MAEPCRGRAVVAGVLCAVGLAALSGGGAAASAPGSVPPLPGEWWWDAMGVDELHDLGRGEGVTVAVVDGPIESDVPDLQGVVVSSETMCLDPARTSDPRPRSPRGTGTEAEHATSMAALIAGTGRGTGPGGRGIRGIAPEATVRHYAVLYDDPQHPDDLTCGIDFPDGDDVDRAVGLAIAEAARDGADVINLSLVTGYSREIEDGLLTAYREGAVVVAGTGNAASRVEWPGLGNGVVLVNPVGQDGRTTDFAVTGSDAIGLAAPGEDVMAGRDDGSGWRSTTLGSGASIATALVSGGIAALWSAHPDATAGQVLQAARQNVGLRAKDDGSGYRTWFRRVGADLPQVQSRNAAYGWGIFAPADAVRVDPTALERTNPFVRDDDTINGPDPAAIAAATAAGGTPEPAASPSAAGSGEPAGEAAASASPPEGTARPWWPLGAAALALTAVAGAVGYARRHATTDQARTTTDGTRHGAAPAEGRNHEC
ncbi:S8 family serine peptidase [uncultured Phycicoccus sp.]|uniref:S8 family peptidase n=1 Tax=uncultured Phycicoccus sp. TaxID=661422 RepID=UPI0026067B7D|nr:S8 family serine peptidase [uncultured Phycicoccus sp.]